jgi:hypothetical protein
LNLIELLMLGEVYDHHMKVDDRIMEWLAHHFKNQVENRKN